MSNIKRAHPKQGPARSPNKKKYDLGYEIAFGDKSENYVWADYTVLSTEEEPYSWKSDDYMILDIPCIFLDEDEYDDEFMKFLKKHLG